MRYNRTIYLIDDLLSIIGRGRSMVRFSLNTIVWTVVHEPGNRRIPMTSDFAKDYLYPYIYQSYKPYRWDGCSMIYKLIPLSVHEVLLIHMHFFLKCLSTALYICLRHSVIPAVFQYL